ncbi:MAG: hypothetical protein LT106_09790 [Burkholderiaceae bacterium]|nr:hypothetical protein [Burkholderiaceae bacterium]
MNSHRRALLAAGGVVACAMLPASAHARARDTNAFAFALIGDVPYNALEVRVLEAVFASFDADLAFALHVGDIKASWEPCSDSLLERRLALLAASPVPLAYVPGDNEWTDCGRARAGGFDPRERLDWLRRRAFGAMAPASSPSPVSTSGPSVLDGFERQSDRYTGGLPENRRWRHGGVRFATLNLPGSNDGLDAAGLGPGDREQRLQANAQWLRDSYRLAAEERAAAVVVAVHANPRFGATDRFGTDGYRPFRSLLRAASDGFAGPTLLLHGDTHRHRVERITRKLLRVESYGSPFVDRWVRIDVEPDAPEPFRISSRSARLGRDEPLASAQS